MLFQILLSQKENLGVMLLFQILLSQKENLGVMLLFQIHLKSCRCTFYKQARFSAVGISDSRGLGRGREIETDRQIYRYTDKTRQDKTRQILYFRG